MKSPGSVTLMVFPTGLCTGALLAAALLLVARTGHGEVIFQQDFGDGAVPRGWVEGFHTNDHNSCCEWSVQNVNDPVAHEGERSLLATCLADDPPVNGHRYRANLTTDPGGSVDGVPILPYDTDRWFGFSVYIPSSIAEEMAHTGIFNTHTHNRGSSECSVANWGPARGP